MLLSIVPCTASDAVPLTVASSMMQPTHWFQGRGIPPERVGLHGEYDHAGLAKRVIAALRLDQEALMTNEIRVMQRGQVVILSGYVENKETLQQIIDRSLQVDGAAFVEFNDVRLMPKCYELGAA